MDNSKISCQPYTTNLFVDVDGTVLIKRKCTYTLNGKIRWELNPCNPLYSYLYGTLCAKVMSFVHVDGTFPEVIYTILVYLF